MNPEIDTTPGLGLPQPSVEIGQASFGYVSDRSRGPEVSAPRFESMPPLSPASAAPASQPSPAIVQTQPVASALMAMPAQDDDADTSALDAEWVNKAKEIVERTHTDPYLQSKELSRIKAQYIKARYSKEIKVSEES